MAVAPAHFVGFVKKQIQDGGLSRQCLVLLTSLDDVPLLLASSPFFIKINLLSINELSFTKIVFSSIDITKLCVVTW